MSFGMTSREICKNTLGVLPEDICRTVLLTPGWAPERLFETEALRVLTDASPLHGYRIWNAETGGKCFTYLRTGFGAPMVLDAVLLRHTPCRRIIFVSSAGALGKGCAWATCCSLPQVPAVMEPADIFKET